MEEGGELQWGQACQGVIPDFKFMTNTPDGPQSSLAELKIISAGKTRYPRGAGVVERNTGHSSGLRLSGLFLWFCLGSSLESCYFGGSTSVPVHLYK